jgi:hypothetical protein
VSAKQSAEPPAVEPDLRGDLSSRLAGDIATLDAELVEIDMLVAQARSEAERHELKRGQTAAKLAALPAGSPADDAGLAAVENSLKSWFIVDRRQLSARDRLLPKLANDLHRFGAGGAAVAKERAVGRISMSRSGERGAIMSFTEGLASNANWICRHGQERSIIPTKGGKSPRNAIIGGILSL